VCLFLCRTSCLFLCRTSRLIVGFPLCQFFDRAFRLLFGGTPGLVRGNSLVLFLNHPPRHIRFGTPGLLVARASRLFLRFPGRLRFGFTPRLVPGIDRRRRPRAVATLAPVANLVAQFLSLAGVLLRRRGRRNGLCARHVANQFSLDQRFQSDIDQAGGNLVESPANDVDGRPAVDRAENLVQAGRQFAGFRERPLALSGPDVDDVFVHGVSYWLVRYSSAGGWAGRQRLKTGFTRPAERLP
jgi:hypothetical protein